MFKWGSKIPEWFFSFREVLRVLQPWRLFKLYTTKMQTAKGGYQVMFSVSVCSTSFLTERSECLYIVGGGAGEK